MMKEHRETHCVRRACRAALLGGLLWLAGACGERAPGDRGAARDSVSEPGIVERGDSIQREEQTGEADAAAAVEALRRYYDAIGRRDFDGAYAMWGDSGRASGQTLEEFRAGFADTDMVNVEPGPPGRIEGAAGSRFIDVPVTVRARATGGAERCFRGSYVLRRVVVDGATAAQRRWHLYSADIVGCVATNVMSA